MLASLLLVTTFDLFTVLYLSLFVVPNVLLFYFLAKRPNYEEHAYIPVNDQQYEPDVETEKDNNLMTIDF